MDPKLLFQLTEVILQGSLSRAALSLHVTQPTLTRNMKAIEEAVGAPVLRRGRYGVTPTTLGERLSQQGSIITDAMNLAEETVQHWRTGLVGEVRLGVSAMLSTALVPEFFTANPMKESNYSIRVIAAEPTELVQKLRKHEINIAILPSHSKAGSHKITQDVLFANDLCILAGSQSPLIRLPGNINIELLITQTWISINNMARIRRSSDQADKLHGIDSVVPKFRFEGDVATPIALLRDSDMLAIAPRYFAKYCVALGGVHILKTDIELPKCDIVLQVSKEYKNNSCVMELSNLLKKHFTDDGGRPKPNRQTTNDIHVMDLP